MTIHNTAMTGWSTGGNNLMMIAWAKDSNSNTYYGLQGFYIDLTGTFYAYNDCHQSFSFCETCQNAGNAVMGLYITSFFLMVLVIFGTIMRMCRDGVLFKLNLLIAILLFW